MRHEFALHVPSLAQLCRDVAVGNTFTIADEKLSHRLKHVLRATQGFQLCLFDRTCAVQATVVAFEAKHNVRFLLEQFVASEVLTPAIGVLLPLLKREALVDALYSCVELGVQRVQLVTTNKSQQAWHGMRDTERIMNIMIAAAEQSKQFSIPRVDDPLPLSTAIRTVLPDNALCIHCDPQGRQFWDVMQQALDQQPEVLWISIGPEGDLTEQERAELYEHAFIPCALTPTVLRATQALVVAVGSLRAAFRK